MAPAKIFVVLPAFNEASVLEQTLSSLVACGYSVILVDDGSTDDTELIAQRFPVFSVKHCLNVGQGAALRTGMAVAKNLNAEIVIHFDSDGQHEVTDIQKLIEPILQNQCDIVFGSRFLTAEGKQKTPPLKKIVLQTARFINWLFYGILLSDAHNGIRAMNRKAFEKIVFTQYRMGHASEILQLVKTNSLRYMELPVTIHYTQYSRVKGQKTFNAVNILFDLIFK